MKKRLLLSFVAIIGAMASFAYNLGDYVYTHDAKFKVISDNMLTNGDFASNYNGWKDYTDSSLNPEFWSIETGASETGGNVLVCNNGAADQTANYIYQAVPYEPSQSYIITFKVKGVDPTTSSVTPNTANYIDVYANADGSVSKSADLFCQVATTDAVKGEWTSYSYAFTDTVTGGSNGFIVVTFGQLTDGTQISDVEIRQVTPVFDTRISDREFAYAEALLGIEAMQNGREELMGIIEGLKEFFNSEQSEDVSTAEDALNSFLAAETDFLNANSYEVNSHIDSRVLWTTKVQKADGTYGDWYVEGIGRWFHDPADDAYIRDFIQATYDLPAGTAKIVKELPAGKYFFSAEVKGHRMAGTSTALRYEPDYSYVVEGAKLFIGNDSVSFDLDQRNFERHFVVADVADGETLNAGFWHPATSVDNKLGGTVYMQNPVLRIIGDNSDGGMEAYIENYATLKNIATQANALKVMLDSAVTVHAKAEYPWGKPELQETITYYTGTYNSLSVKQPGDDLFAEAADSLMQSMRLVRSSIQAYYSLNAPYTELVAQLVIANASYNNPANAAGDKATFKAVIDKAQALIDAVTAEYSEDVANNMIAVKVELVEAQKTFEVTTATFNNPSEVEVVNPYFAKFTNASTIEGWTVVLDGAINGQWSQGTGSKHDGGTHIQCWRGYTAYPQNKASQDITLLHSGVYVLSCQSIAYNENGGRDGDRTVDSGIYYYGKLKESADSIGTQMVHTYRTHGYYPELFAVVYEKTDNNPETIELGFTALGNTCCNQYTFGGNHVRYMGQAAKFNTDLAAALAQNLAEANTQYEAAAAWSDDATVEPVSGLTYAYIYENLGYAIEFANVAENSNNKMTAYYKLVDALANVNLVTSGVKGIVVEPATNIQKGVYNISGVKVAESADALPKGLYIVNGKKVVVK